MGKSAYDFVDFLQAAGQTWWQLLPLGPTSFGDSPYASFSTFAGNPYYIDPDILVRDGLLTPADIAELKSAADTERVDYGRLYRTRYPVLRKAFANGRTALAEDMAAFRAENAAWVENYALYMALKQHFGMKAWTQWPDERIRLHRPDAVHLYREKLRDEVDFWVFLQFLFFRQWNALRAYAAERGVRFFGDIPIYVALDSADIWADPQFFQLDSENRPTEVSGVPPDSFTADGQLWGNPLYRWDRMKADGFGWWIRRVEGATRLYDMIRIDHFRGLESYWAVPAGDTTARNGKWKKGPGMDLVGVLTSWFNDTQFVAEDLGYPTPEVRKLLADSGLPGMRLLEFAFYAGCETPDMPHRHIANCVCYMGTHDNETCRGWVKHANPADLALAKKYMHITDDEGWCWGMIRTGMASPANLFVAQMQDVLELDETARMNTPGTASGNWQWRMKPDALTPALAAKLRDYTETYRRLPDEKKPAQQEVIPAPPPATTAEKK